jgi:outer membrane receptor protein involved in Fe transport
VGLFAVTFLHSGQDVHNHNPAVDMLNLPVDNSIEYNPTAVRNVHHVQWTGSLSSKRGSHLYKTGVLLDDQYGNEIYEITPASQLSMNALAALAPNMVPSGNIQTDPSGNPVLDINGNPVYRATSNNPATLKVHRSGFYRAAYLQDTWQMSKRFNVNYGVRADWYKQTQNLGQPTISTFHLCPRLNFTYSADRLTTLRWSYNRLFNTPPLAQGAVVGQPIEPELLDQYDVSVERQIARGQTMKIAYYVKQIHNQVDTGLLIPGSQIGLYSAVNLQYGGIHGIEFSYELTPVKEYGWDAYVNYTYSIARPNGVDNTGAPVPDFNDHDQRNTLGIGVAYNWKSGASAAVTINHGSGLASSPTGTDGRRIPRTQVDLRLSTGPKPFHGRGGVGLDITNIFDDRTVINFQSAFSGTRFQQGRRILASAFVRF